jgi:two-component system, OmpR family, osmolarity sensor histidine kinase EnvZ
MAWLRALNGLRVRVGLIVVIHLIAVGLLIALMTVKPHDTDPPLFRLVPPDEVLAIARAVETVSGPPRDTVLRGLSVGTTLVTLGDGDVPPPLRPGLRQKAEDYRAVLEGRPLRFDFHPDATLRDLGPDRMFSEKPVRIRVWLRDGAELIIERTAPPAISSLVMRLNYILIGLALVGVIVVVALAGQTTRPLSRLVRALNRDGARLSAPDLPVTGAREIRQLSIAFNAMRHRLKLLVEERTVLLAAVAHDFRTYLTRLELRADHIADPRQRALAMADLAEMTALLDDTLTFAQVSATARAPSSEVTDLAATLRTTLETRALTGAEVALATPLPEAVAVRIGAVALQRILDNLLDNAVRYGGAARLGVRRDASTVAIDIDDDGPGVPEADLDGLTRPFHRLEHSRARHTGGAGLGLAIVDALAQQQGGTLTLANRPGGGFRATVRLPAA